LGIHIYRICRRIEAVLRDERRQESNAKGEIRYRELNFFHFKVVLSREAFHGRGKGPKGTSYKTTGAKPKLKSIRKKDKEWA